MWGRRRDEGQPTEAERELETQLLEAVERMNATIQRAVEKFAPNAQP